MVARSPPKQLRRHVVVPNLNLTHLRETVNKVDQCMARLQELQYTVRGGTKAVSRKQEPFRMRSTNSRKSPNGKLRTTTDEWRRMSLPAMLLGETMGEILQASQFAKNIVQVVSKTNIKSDDPKTPITERRKPKPNFGTNSSLQARRKREKRVALQTIRSENDEPKLQRAKSKINFKASPVHNRERDTIANGFSQRNGPWVKRSVLLSNPLFHSSTTSHHQEFSKTKSPVIARKRQTPHKFLIKSPPVVGSKFHVKVKSPTVLRSPKAPMSNAKLRRPMSPSRLANRLASPFKSRKLAHGNEGAMMTPHKFLIKSPRPVGSTSRFHIKIKSPTRSMTRTRANKKSPKAATSAAAKFRRSLSPARLANRLMSPLKSRKSVQQNEVAMKFTSGPKQRSTAFSVRFSPRRI